MLFVTANLNAGGAQRSLTNLARALAGRVPLEIAVTGRSSSAAFFATLREAGVTVYRTSDARDAFDHAEALVRRIAGSSIGVVCFWNVDAKVKPYLPTQYIDKQFWIDDNWYAENGNKAIELWNAWLLKKG